MKTIKMTGNFGSTLFYEHPIIDNTEEGIVIECPISGYVYVKNLYECNTYEYHCNTIISQKKKLFQKLKEEKYKIYFINNGFINCKGYVNLPIFDLSYGNVSTEVNITYDYYIRVAIGRAEQFINFANSFRIKNASNGEIYQNILNKEIEKNIREILSKELTEHSVTSIQAKVNNLCFKITQQLNSNNSHLYNWGISVENFSFDIIEDYSHREEKKRVEHNQELYNR